MEVHCEARMSAVPLVWSQHKLPIRRFVHTPGRLRQQSGLHFYSSLVGISSCSCCCSLKDLILDIALPPSSAIYSKGFPASDRDVAASCRHAWIACLCIVWLDVPVSLCLSPAQNRSCLGRQWSSMLIMWPDHLGWDMIKAWMPGRAARRRKSWFVTWSSQWISRSLRRQRRWNWSSFLMWRQ